MLPNSISHSNSIRSNHDGDSAFHNFFCTATGHTPYPYQEQVAISDIPPDLIEIPTGLGKTEAVILGWLWRRRFDPEKRSLSVTPRRLVYCLPMRVLVEQTRAKVEQWLSNLGMLADAPGDTIPVEGFAQAKDSNQTRIAVTVLMGGEEREWWDIYPERDAIIIGTQDMLLSRALNRGYGMSKYRWPTQFGLFNNDCLWVMDEIQLMGRGLATTTQLQAFRRILGTVSPTPCGSIWMSATLEPEWLHTVDFHPEEELNQKVSLSEADKAHTAVQTRTQAVKILQKAENDVNEQKRLASEILEKHQKGSRTLVVVNTVRHATTLYKELLKLIKNNSKIKCILIHSHFRPPDRKTRIQELLESPGDEGSIIISTQVVEAGVDISAKVLFTEVAPWSSLVQRFGRCNRSGEYKDAEIYWIDIPTDKKGSTLPYSEDEIITSSNLLGDLEGKSVSPSNLPLVKQKVMHQHVIRKKDIRELFDTTPDLAGSDIDISHFIRETSDTDVQVFWRDIQNDDTSQEKLPNRDELCSVPVKDMQNLIYKKVKAWRWDSLDEKWTPVKNNVRINPGMTLMLQANDGCYTPIEGWNPSSKAIVPVISCHPEAIEAGYSGNEMAVGSWQTIAEHTDRVSKEMEIILDSLGLNNTFSETLMEAVRWHDAGKSHQSFQAMIRDDLLKEFSDGPVAKAPQDAWKRRVKVEVNGNEEWRKFFRHELASGILALQNGRSDLVAYLAAAHHGKVRGSIRSMPDELRPSDMKRRFARGVWDGDIIQETYLGDGVTVPETTLDLSYMELGNGLLGSSWSARVLNLRDRTDLGPFRVAYLESLIKAADERASRGEI